MILTDEEVDLFESNEDKKAHRHWVFVVNNYTEDDCARIRALPHVFIVVGKEVGAKGTPHLQGYVVTTPTKFTAMKRAIPRGCIRWSKATNITAAAAYAMKDNIWYTAGTPTHQGVDSEHSEYRDAVLQGASEHELNLRFPKLHARYPEWHNRIKRAKMDFYHSFVYNRDRRQTFWVWGPAGVDKSRLFDDIFYPERGKIVFTSSGFAQQYNGHSVVKCEEFKGQLDYESFKRLTDPYQDEIINIKGGERPWNAKFFYITSNYAPEQVYRIDETFHRRVKVYKFPEDYDECNRALQRIKRECEESASRHLECAGHLPGSGGNS